MIINKIQLKNFRSFQNFEANFHPELTVIVGNNGAGKSALLDATAIAIGTFLNKIDGIDSKSISKDDATLMGFDMGSVTDMQSQFPVLISSIGELDGKVVKWDRGLNSSNSKTTIVDAKEMTTISQNYQDGIRTGNKNIILPLISNYGTGRLWAQKKEKRSSSGIKKFTRTDGYTDCLSATSNEKFMIKWFEKMTIKSASEEKLIPEFEIVKNAISSCFESISNHTEVKTSFDIDTHSINISAVDENGNAYKHSLKTLSDGYKNTISMIADIAYRMALLNPQLLDKALCKTPGIILIDEIDLHLHPRWQQRIIGDLRKLFPKIQFIVSTHAPSVISSVKKDNLLILEKGAESSYITSEEVYGNDSNYILKNVMDSNERPIEITKYFDEFYCLVDDEKWEDAEILLEKLEAIIGSNDSELISAKVTLALR